MSARQENAGESLFERYLARWGYHDYERHPGWLNPPKQPDYLIRTPAGEVVVEVKSFETWGLFENLQQGMIATRSVTKTLKPVRDRISKAAAQMKGITGRPLVVVLANPDNRMPLSAPNVIFAMYGDPIFAFPADPEQAGRWVAGRNGELHLVNEGGIAHGGHAHLSAVAVLRGGPNGDGRGTGDLPVTLDVFETVSDRCEPLPTTVFAHQGDTRWGSLGPDRYGQHGDDETP
jgi:hypothetical protein